MRSKFSSQTVKKLTDSLSIQTSRIRNSALSIELWCAKHTVLYGSTEVGGLQPKKPKKTVPNLKFSAVFGCFRLQCPQKLEEDTVSFNSNKITIN